MSFGAQCSTTCQPYPPEHWSHRWTGKHWPSNKQSLLPFQRFPLRVMAAEFLCRSDAHQYGVASQSTGHSNHRPHITAEKHGPASAANVSTLSHIDYHCWSAAFTFDWSHHWQYTGGSFANSSQIPKFQRWRWRLRWDESKWTNEWWCIGIIVIVITTEWIFRSIGCVNRFQFVGQWIWNRKKFKYIRQSKWIAERREVSRIYIWARCRTPPHFIC